TVTWTPPSPLGNTTGYRISYTTGSDVDIDGGSTNSYTLTGLTNGKTYTISIVTTSSGLPSAPLVVTVSLVPSAPFIDSTPTVSATTVTITGSVPRDSVVTGFLVQWQRDTSGGCTNEDEGSINATGSFTSYTITGLEEGNRYTITVKLYNDAGRGPVSNSVTAKTIEAAPSGSPASITVGTLTANSVTLQWGEVACLERNGEITGYTVTAANSDGVVKGTSSVNVDARQATISGLTPSTQYTVSVAAVNGAGTGPVTALPVETEGPPPPTGVTAVQDGPTSITVTWTPPSPLGDTTGYRISYNTGSDVDIDGDSSNSYTLTGLTNGQTYTISIVAIAPNRPTSSPIEAQVSLVGVPEKPTVDMDNIETSPTTITTSWSFPPDATGSEVSWELTGHMRRRRVSNAEGGTSGRLSNDQNSYTIGRLRSGTSYDIAVTVFNPAGNSSTTWLQDLLHHRQ
ncbi:Receptor-type tyrosine-protein phosphatase F, partial [Geodia barretti]